MNRTPIFAALLALTFAALLFAPTQSSHLLTSADLASLYGGAGCYVDGTQNCPAASDCAKTDCINFGKTCPSENTKLNYQGPATYPYAALTNDTGRAGKPLQQAAIARTVEYTCTGCTRVLGGTNTCAGKATGVTGTSRIPTTPDPASAQCNAKPITTTPPPTTGD